MSSLSTRLKPFLGSCSLTLSAAMRKRAEGLDIKVRGDSLSLYVFNWAKVPQDLRDEMREQAGQADAEPFAVVNPDLDEEELGDMIDAAHDGYLFASAKGDRIYHGDGEVELFTSDVADFLANLSEEDEDDEDDEDDDYDDDDDDDD